MTISVLRTLLIFAMEAEKEPLAMTLLKVCLKDYNDDNDEELELLVEFAESGKIIVTTFDEPE